MLVHQHGGKYVIRKPRIDMSKDIISLKQYVEELYSGKVIISNLIGRTDNGKANLTIKHFNEKLSSLKIPIMDNSNITPNYLGKKGLHLSSPYGTTRLASNLLNLLKNL